jgi:AcrR family transcriptional regulator
MPSDYTAATITLAAAPTANGAILVVNPMSTSDERQVARRPGGRTADVTVKIYTAVQELLIKGGAKACGFAAVAERAGIERSTLHRRFADKWEMIIDAFMAKGQASIVPDDTGSFAGDLRSLLVVLASALESPLGPAMLAAAAEMRVSNPDFPRTYFDRRMNQLDPMFDRAIARAELGEDVDRELVFSSAAGPLYFRLFITGRQLDDSFIDSVVGSVRRLYCTAGAGPHGAAG